MRGRCERANGGSDTCEKNGLIFYPKCRSGYSAFGCCICRPAVPDCQSLGLNAGIDLSCTKKIIIGDPIPMSCAPGKNNDAGLCYAQCRSGYSGVGPVCWGQPPRGWVNCGMGAAKDSGTCAQIVFDQVSSVGEMALAIATAGSSSSATATTKFAKLQQAAKKTQKVVDLLNQAKMPKDINDSGKGLQDILTADANSVRPEDAIRMAAELAAYLDPSGVSGVVAAYTYRKCTQVSV